MAIAVIYALSVVKRIFIYLPRAYSDGSNEEAREEFPQWLILLWSVQEHWILEMHRNSMIWWLKSGKALREYKRQELPAICSGSHLDSVRQRGNYDGVLVLLYNDS